MNTGVRRAELSWTCECGWNNELSRAECMGCDKPRPNTKVSLEFCLWVQAGFDELMGRADIFPSKSPLHGQEAEWFIARSK